ncbi:MAG: F0F1 ATP synthase subunit A [Acidobacteriota bacterium]
MHEQSPVADFLNQCLFDPLARVLGVRLAAGQHALPDHIVMILLVSWLLITFSLWLRGRLSVENPSRAQHLVEVVLAFLQGLMQGVIGKDYRPYLPLIGTLGIYILVGNILGLVPGFISPTSNLNVTASCAIPVFIYYNYHGIRKHGLRTYLAHFVGPVWWLAPMLFPVEIVSHLARMLSLSMRLFGNIFAEELVISSLNHIFPFLASVLVMFLALFASTIQAGIFMILTMVYISGAVEESAEHKEEHAGEHANPTTPQTHAAAA